MYELLSRDLLLISHMNTSRAAQLGIKTPADYVAQVRHGGGGSRAAALREGWREGWQRAVLGDSFRDGHACLAPRFLITV